MNSKAKSLIMNFKYTFNTNLLSFLVSTLVVLIVPKLVGVEEYGYWQIYLFYSSFTGFLSFGWNDGMHLRYGGKDYNELNKELFFSQFYMFTLFQILIAFIILITSNVFVSDYNKTFILKMVIMCMIIGNVRSLLIYILQATNKIKEYANILMLDRIIYIILIAVLLILGFNNYKILIVADIISKLISLIYSMYCCWEIVFCKFSKFYLSFRETYYNISAGIKLTIANIASLLNIGTVRFGIEYSWDVTTFGKVSLALSISNFMMIFINAMGLIMYPLLRKINEEQLKDIYIYIRDILMAILFLALIIYYPFKFVLSMWLPQYLESLKYMALIFPMCIYEGKMALLINTYLKTLRKEKLMMNVNIISVLLSLLLTFLTTIIFKNLNIAISSILIILAFRSIIAEIYLSKILKIQLHKDIILELSLSIVFVLTGWYLNSLYAAFVYFISYLIYILVKKKDILNTIRKLKLLLI